MRIAGSGLLGCGIEVLGDFDVNPMSLNKEYLKTCIQYTKVTLANVSDNQLHASRAKKLLTNFGFKLVSRFKNPFTKNWNNLYKYVNLNFRENYHDEFF